MAFRQWLESRTFYGLRKKLGKYEDRPGEVGMSARILLDIDEDDAKAILEIYQEALDRASGMIKAPVVDWDPAIEGFLGRAEFPSSSDDLFPVPAYISADDDMTVGILVHADGALELFEGNDEASDATYELINELLGGGKKRLYGSHRDETVQRIIETGTVPAGLYFSPDRSYAAGHWALDRQLVSAVFDMKDLRQESDKDWRTIRDANVSSTRTH